MVNGSIREVAEELLPNSDTIRTTIGILPMSDRVIVEQLSESEVTEGGIIIPDNSQEKPAMGTIVAIGEGKLVAEGGYRIPCPYQIGHVVIFGKYAGMKLTKKFLVNVPLTEDDISAMPASELIGVTHDQKIVERTFLIMREDEINGIDLDGGKPLGQLAKEGQTTAGSLEGMGA